MNFSKTALAVGSAIGVQDLIDAVEDLKLEDVLGVIGLERRSSPIARLLPAAGLITISAAIGAGVALLLAPSSGSKLRARISGGLTDAKHRLSDSISELETPRASKHAVS